MPGVVIDNKLQFKSHMQELCEKAFQKLEGLSPKSHQGLSLKSSKWFWEEIGFSLDSEILLL